jgi:PIN domain nuclease of toxin-antitoxin system
LGAVATVILLDTHALIWWVADPKRVPAKATRVINAALKRGETLGVSSITTWEVALLGRLRRLKLTMEVDTWLSKVEGLPFLFFYPVDNRVARRAAMLEIETRDPADRIIVATAMEHGATLVSADEQMHAYTRVNTVWD